MQNTLSSAKTLDVFEIDDLREIWPGDLQAKAREIKVGNCHKLSTILFPSNLIECMQKLGLLDVASCESMGR